MESLDQIEKTPKPEEYLRAFSLAMVGLELTPPYPIDFIRFLDDIEAYEIDLNDYKNLDCLLCNRISKGDVMIPAFDLWPRALALKIGVRASELIKEAYLRDRPGMCGKSPSGLIGGALYIAQFLIEGDHQRWPQQDIANNIGIATITITNRYRGLLEIMNELKELLAFQIKDCRDKRLLRGKTWKERGRVF